MENNSDNPKLVESSKDTLKEQPFVSPVVSAPFKSKPPLVLLVIFLLLLFGFGGIFLGKYLYAPKTIAIPTPTPKPTVIPTVISNPTAIPTSLPTSAETANWKTYTNEKLGFSIKYPEEFSEPQESQLSTRTDIEFSSDFTIGVGIFYDQDKQRELTYLEIARQYSENKKEPQQIKIDGQPAAYLKMREEDLIPPKPNPFDQVVIQKGKIIYKIDYSFSTTLLEQEKEQKIFDQILSTFKFTSSQTSVDPTAN